MVFILVISHWALGIRGERVGDGDALDFFPSCLRRDRFCPKDEVRVVFPSLPVSTAMHYLLIYTTLFSRRVCL